MRSNDSAVSAGLGGNSDDLQAARTAVHPVMVANGLSMTGQAGPSTLQDGARTQSDAALTTSSLADGSGQGRTERRGFTQPTSGRRRYLLTVTDVRQYFYCPRIVYYRLCQPVKAKSTYKMEEGKLAQERVAELEHRRTLRAYGVDSGDREFDVTLISEELGLRGLLDMVIVRDDEVIPVEYKNTSRRPPKGYAYQLAAYAMLAERRWSQPSRRGFVYLIPEKRAVEVAITPTMRQDVEDALAAMRSMIGSEAQPGPTERIERCRECEYRFFCGDVE